jgi:hypothetical protein
MPLPELLYQFLSDCLTNALGSLGKEQAGGRIGVSSTRVGASNGRMVRWANHSMAKSFVGESDSVVEDPGWWSFWRKT